MSLGIFCILSMGSRLRLRQMGWSPALPMNRQPTPEKILIAANIRNIAIADFQSFGIEERAGGDVEGTYDSPSRRPQHTSLSRLPPSSIAFTHSVTHFLEITAHPCSSSPWS